MILNVSSSPFQDIKSQANMPHFPPSSSTHLTSTFISFLIPPSSHWHQRIPQLNQRQWGKVESFLPTIQKIFKVIVGILIFPLGIYWLYEYWCYKSKEKSLETFVKEIGQLPDFKNENLSFDALSKDRTSEEMKFLKNHCIPLNFKEYRNIRFHISVSELKNMRDSIQVSYNTNLLTPSELKTMLKLPYPKISPSDLYGRIFSSLCVSLYDFNGNPRQKKNREFPVFRIYTCNLPEYKIRGPSIDEYEKKSTEVLRHFFHEAQSNENEVVIFPPLDNLFKIDYERSSQKDPSPQVKQSFINALEKVLMEKEQSFKKIIFADPKLMNEIEEMRQKNSFSNLIVTSKNFLEIAHLGAEKGLNVGLLNPTAIALLPNEGFSPRNFMNKEFVHGTTIQLGQNNYSNDKNLFDFTHWKSYTPPK